MKEKVISNTRLFLNSTYFSIILASITSLSFILNLGFFPYYIAALSAIVLFIFKADFTCLFLIFMLCIASTNTNSNVSISNPNIYIISFLCLIVLILLIKETIVRRNDLKRLFSKDFVFLSLILIFVTMFISLINTETIHDSLVGISYFFYIISSYFFARFLIISTDDNKKKTIKNLIICGWIIFFEFTFMLVEKINEGYSLSDIYGLKILNFVWAHQNHYSAFTNICILLSIYYYVSNTQLTKKIFSFISIIAFLLVCVLIGGRAGIITLLITIPLLIILSILDIKKTGWQSKKYDLPIISIVCCLLVISVIVLFAKGYVSKYINYFKEYGIFNYSGRNYIFEIAIEQFKKHPIIGSGVYSSHYYFNKSEHIALIWFNWNYHNYYLQMLGTCGLLGAIAFTIFLFFSIKRVLHKNMYSMLTLTVTIYFLIHGLLDTMYFDYVIMPILMVTIALINDKEDKYMKNILVLGGAGYIGSHTCVELLNNNYSVIIYDNLSNSKEVVIDRIKEITKKDPIFVKGDVLCKEELEQVFSNYKIDAVINFAGFKAVGESVKVPLKYYEDNVSGAINVLEIMQKYNVFNFIFSSTATVYGNPQFLPFTEDHPVGNTTNPYATTKYFIERILEDLYNSDKRFNIAILRYFNPFGAHESGLIGEDPNGIPNNLAPYITQVAIGKLPFLNIYGNNYNTPDGTGIRDYIHVCDLATGHIQALKKLFTNPGLIKYNLGTGKGQSVFDVLHAFEKACGFEIPYKIVERRPGDIDAFYADSSKASKELGFNAKYTIDDMCSSAWNFQKKNS